VVAVVPLLVKVAAAAAAVRMAPGMVEMSAMASVTTEMVSTESASEAAGMVTGATVTARLFKTMIS